MSTNRISISDGHLRYGDLAVRISGLVICAVLVIAFAAAGQTYGAILAGLFIPLSLLRAIFNRRIERQIEDSRGRKEPAPSGTERHRA